MQQDTPNGSGGGTFIQFSLQCLLSAFCRDLDKKVEKDKRFAHVMLAVLLIALSNFNSTTLFTQ